ncbi:STAS domain-containing protein [Kiloniella laminariae]|uniref:STAS domain-containing protein n=1 Tax=Kiloniella laminariae TaxID=454162 RepID=A0ABT4LMD4_9PROT|nr:STAS domain-containing protein [Kiloniella laminariae]MCZ4282277.1 STAS domain-containing protein [Kiloniella laminariae]
MKLEVSEQTATISLNPCLDMASAESLLEIFLDCDNRALNLKIDASAVEKASTACIQVIHSAAVSCIDAGRAFQISQASETLVTAFKDLGLYSNITMMDEG